MPISTAFNKTSATSTYPVSIPNLSQHLKRETNSTPDELRSQARTLNVLITELMQVMEVLGTDANWTAGQSLADLQVNSTIFGDGSDGDVVVSMDDTLVADMYYNNLTVETGITLDTGGFRVFVRNTLTLEGTAIISNDGNSAVLDTPGAATTVGSLGTGSAGGAPEANGSALANTKGSAGGDGGGAVFGNGGVVTPAVAVGLRDIALATTLIDSFGILNGGSGGGGGENGSSDGGAGGGGGGVVMIAARSIVGDSNSSITANGGNGGNGGGAGDGGGGGGGGGLVVVLSTNTVNASIAVTATRGDGGTGAGGNGSDGTDGTAIVVVL